MTPDIGTVNGSPVARSPKQSIYDACLDQARLHAHRTGQPALVHAVDTIGARTEYWLNVYPDGHSTTATPPASDQHPRQRHLAPAPPTAQADAPHGPQALPPPAIDEQQPAATRHPPPTLDDLIAQRPTADDAPAEQGWQSVVRRLTGGLITPKPGPEEQQRRAQVVTVRRNLAGPKTVVIINVKGGATKTTATVLISATFGLARGGSVLAWDNNETRGTLGWRALHAGRSLTAVDLLRDLNRFEKSSDARLGDLDAYVRHQGAAQFDVLASDEDPQNSDMIDADAFQRLHETLARFYRLIVVDTGNNLRAPNYQAALDIADQLVIVSTIEEDTAGSAGWVVDALRSSGRTELVDQAVTVLAAPAGPIDGALHRRLRQHFAQTRAVLDVPFDPHLVGGRPINIDKLRSRTRDAWIPVAAAIAEGLR